MKKRRIGRRATAVTGIAVLVTAQAWAAKAGRGPLKVFILAGQSNMEGQGIIGGSRKGTLEYLVKNPASAERYRHLVDRDGKWRVRDDVWIAYGTKGHLTVGGYAAKGCIGPELGFGWVVGDYLDEQVLLIKFGVGGTSLAGNWRPASSGGQVGEWYTNMIKGVKEQLANLKKDFPGYDEKGYEIAGFGWHQGWQDGCNAKMAAEYEKNLANFVRDVRKDLGAPKMPFVIGGSGFAGWQQKVGRRLAIMNAQAAVARYDEFKGNVVYVETRGFYRAEDVSPHRFRYHWNGNAETFYLIGDGMGRAMVALMGGPAFEDASGKAEAAGARTVNDSYADAVYSGGWASYRAAAEIGGDEHYDSEKGASCELAFSGTGIALVGVRDLDCGEAEVYLDGAGGRRRHLQRSAALAAGALPEEGAQAGQAYGQGRREGREGRRLEADLGRRRRLPGHGVRRGPARGSGAVATGRCPAET